MSFTIDLGDIEAARRAIAGHVHRTPLAASRTLSELLGTRVSLKMELFQKTGSFKPRGAFNELLNLSPEDREQGVVGLSGGNFAQGVAFAGRVLGVATTVVMPRETPSNYVEATRGYGADVELVSDITEAFARIDGFRERGLTFVHPFDDPYMMAGNGTLALELLDDAPDATDVFVSIGGGGLMSGVTTALKARRPAIRVWGVETAGADAMAMSLAQGKVVHMTPTSIAKTLGAPFVSETALDIAGRHLEELIVVDDEDAYRGVRFLMDRVKVLAEPAAACTVPAAQRVAGRLGEHVVLILCGGNLPFDELVAWEDRFGE